jgi:hypothetical protein
MRMNGIGGLEAVEVALAVEVLAMNGEEAENAP